MSSRARRACAIAVLAVLFFAGCSQEQELDPSPGHPQIGSAPNPAESAASGWTVRMVTISPMLAHVHGILANADGSLLAGTHAGLYHIDSEGKAEPVGTT